MNIRTLLITALITTAPLPMYSMQTNTLRYRGPAHTNPLRTAATVFAIGAIMSSGTSEAFGENRAAVRPVVNARVPSLKSGPTAHTMHYYPQKETDLLKDELKKAQEEKNKLILKNERLEKTLLTNQTTLKTCQKNNRDSIALLNNCCDGLCCLICIYCNAPERKR